MEHRSPRGNARTRSTFSPPGSKPRERKDSRTRLLPQLMHARSFICPPPHQQELVVIGMFTERRSPDEAPTLEGALPGILNIAWEHCFLSKKQDIYQV